MGTRPTGRPVGRPPIGPRLGARLYPHERLALDLACHMTGETLSDFIRAAVVERAERVNRQRAEFVNAEEAAA